MTQDGPARLLVIEDDRTTADLAALYLRHAGFRVDVEHSGDAALVRCEAQSYDLFVLDVMLPGATGFDICKRIRNEGDAGIILLTARTSEADRIHGLDLGADDYVPKPFSPRELVARVRAVLRRKPPASDHRLRRGELTIDRVARTVHLAGRSIELTPSEFALLIALAARPGRVLSRAVLLDVLPGERGESLERTVDVHIRNLRRKIEANPAAPVFLQTVLGAGYRFGAH